MTILYEDNHIIAVNKEAGELVQGDKTGDICLIDKLKDYIKHKYNKPGEVFLGLPHRIDRPTSGVVVFARTSKALQRLNTMFQSHDDIHKTYLAIVEQPPQPPQGELQHFLLKNEKQNKSYVLSPLQAEKNKAAKLAKLRYKTIAVEPCKQQSASASKPKPRYALVEVTLLTGRHHQIRCQLAAVGCPIKGDLKYGARRSNTDGSICLHAWKISFIHPVSKQQIDIEAPMPVTNTWLPGKLKTADDVQ